MVNTLGRIKVRGPSPGISSDYFLLQPSLHNFGNGLVDYIGGVRLPEGRILDKLLFTVDIHTAENFKGCNCLQLNHASVSISSLLLLQKVFTLLH